MDQLLLLLKGKSTMTLERHKYDVLVIGAGGAGLRAAAKCLLD